MKKNKIVKIAAYLILLASIIVLTFNILPLDFETIKSRRFSIISNILAAIAMIFTIIESNKREKT